MLINNKKIEFIKSFFLLLLVLNFSASAYFIKSMDKETCCHAKVEEVKPMSCCSAEEPQAVQHKCNIDFRTIPDFTTTCGCFHNVESSKQVLQLNKVPESPRPQIEAEIPFESVNQIAVSIIANNRLFSTYESPPIYLIDSSFLI